MTVRDYVFVKSFAYDERFLDIVTPQSIEQAVRGVYGVTIETIAHKLAEERGGDVSATRMSATIRTVFDPLLDTYLTAIHREGWRRFRNDPVIQHELGALLEYEPLAARIAAVLPPFPGEDANTWQQTIVEAVEAAMSARELGPLFEQMFGAYGVHGFDHYDFAIAVSLPGTVVETNATNRERGVMKWAFTQEDFWVDDYLLRARSRIVYPARIALALTGLMLPIVVVGWWGSTPTNTG